MAVGINDNTVDLKIDNSGDVEKKKAARNSNIDSNNQIVNLAYDPNKVNLELIREKAGLESRLGKMIFDILYECEACREKQSEKIEELTKLYKDTVNAPEKQINLGKSFIFNPTYSLRMIEHAIMDAKKGFGFELCDVHKKEKYKEMKYLEIEIDSLDKSIELIK